jgi:hypothetical protein
MTPEIHRAALRAAARLALSAAVPAFLFACGSTAPASSDESSVTETSEADLSAACANRVDTYCNAMHPYETKVQCCQAEVADAEFPTPLHMGPDPDKRVDLLTRGCCTVLAKNADESKNMFNWPERGQCCAAIGWNAAGTCTPWGPPVPPAMKRAAKLVA